MTNDDLIRLVWLGMALLLVSGASYGFRVFRQDGKNALLSLGIWAGILAAIVVLYRIFN